MSSMLKDAKEVMRAHADIEGEGVSGSADFVEYENGTSTYIKVIVEIKADVAVLPSGLHGCHIHEKGICEAPDFKSAGGHFDPGPAGNTDPDMNHPYHMGDLPNILIEEDGEGRMEAISTRFTLSPGPLSILEGEGASIMIHVHKDPYISGEHGSGVSGGARAACGVIREVRDI